MPLSGPRGHPAAIAASASAAFPGKIGGTFGWSADGKDGELLFDIAAVAVRALRLGVVTRKDAFKCQATIAADVFKDRHN